MIYTDDFSIETTREFALELFGTKGGYGWSEAVLLAVSKATGQNCDCIPRIASGFQGGMGVGEVCGAISGAVLAIGLLYGQDQPEAAHHLTREFMRQYAEQNGAVRCIDITGVDMGSTMGLIVYLVKGGKKKCNRVVGGAVQVLLDLLEDWES